MNNNKNMKRCRHSLSFLNANARSLGPKILSLADCFNEMMLDFATVTETWFQSEEKLEEIRLELLEASAIDLISRQRDTIANNGRKYGGVALLFKKNICSFKAFPLGNPENYEILAAVGSVTGVKGKVFVVSCYAPPNLRQSHD